MISNLWDTDGSDQCSILTVDVGINPVVKFIDLGSKVFRIEVEGSLVGRNKVIEGSVEDTNDF